MEINRNAPVQGAQEILIEASPEKVWQILTGIDHWPTWQPQVVTARLNGALLPGSTFDWKSGGSRIHSTLHTVEPCRSFGWTGKVWGIYAIHNWTLTRKAGATLLRTEESMQGILASMLKKMLTKTLLDGSNDWLNKIKQQAEALEKQ